MQNCSAINCPPVSKRRTAGSAARARPSARARISSVLLPDYSAASSASPKKNIFFLSTFCRLLNRLKRSSFIDTNPLPKPFSTNVQRNLRQAPGKENGTVAAMICSGPNIPHGHHSFLHAITRKRPDRAAAFRWFAITGR